MCLNFVFCVSPDVDIQYIGGADPEMVFLDKDYNEVEVRMDVDLRRRRWCVLTSMGYDKGRYDFSFGF